MLEVHLIKNSISSPHDSKFQSPRFHSNNQGFSSPVKNTSLGLVAEKL